MTGQSSRRRLLPCSPLGVHRAIGILFILSVLPLVAACAAAALGSPVASLTRDDQRVLPALTSSSLLPTVSGAELMASVDYPLLPGPYPVGALTRTLMSRSVTTGEERPIQLVLWYPAARSAVNRPPDRTLRGVVDAPLARPGRFPVVVFSHGAGSSPTQSTFLTAQLASHGFIVAAPSHPGTTVDDCLGCGDQARLLTLLIDSAANRPAEVSFALDTLEAMDRQPGSGFTGAIATERAAVAGHSWGGYTAVVAAAADPRFRAVVALASVVNDETDEAAQRLKQPIMVLGGYLDDITPYAWQDRLFRKVKSDVPRYLVAFPRGGHTAFSDVCVPLAPSCRPGDLPEARAHTLVGGYITAFLQRYLLDDNRYASLFAPTFGGSDVLVVTGGR